MVTHSAKQSSMPHEVHFPFLLNGSQTTTLARNVNLSLRLGCLLVRFLGPACAICNRWKCGAFGNFAHICKSRLSSRELFSSVLSYVPYCTSKRCCAALRSRLLDPTLASMFSIYIFRFRPPFVRNRYESGLTSTLRQLGPVICIGKPGEIYPEIGAARIYVSDAHWKDAVEYFFKHAAAVIFTVGRTESLWWEINTALSVVSLDRLLFFFPFAEKVGTRGSLFRRYWAFIGLGLTTRKMLDRMETERRARYELFRKSIQSFLPKSLPDTLGKSLFIDFSGDGTARLLQTKRPIDKAIVWSFSNVSWTQVSFRRTLKSFFEKFHQ